MKEKRLTLSSNPSGEVSFNRPSSEFRSRFIELEVIRGLVKSGLGDCEQVKLDTPVSIITPPPTTTILVNFHPQHGPSNIHPASIGGRGDPGNSKTAAGLDFNPFRSNTFSWKGTQ